jgi:O-antigen ligase
LPVSEVAIPSAFADRRFHFFDQLARWAAVVLLYAAPTSRALFNVTSLVILLSWLLAGRYAQRWAVVRGNLVLWPCVALVSIMLIGITYTVAPLADVLEHVRVYSKFLFVLLLVSLLDQVVWRQRAWGAFALAMLVTVGTTYLNIWWDPPWSTTRNQGWGVDHSVFVDYIIQGVVSTFFMVLALERARAAKQVAMQAIWLVVAAATLVSVIFLLQGRTGQIAILAVFMVYAYQITPARWRWPVIAAGLVLLVALMAASPLLQARVLTAWAEFQRFQADDYQSSVGIRLKLWEFSWELIRQHPFWGHGTGAYHVLASRVFSDCTLTCFHPHNQFLFFWLENGLPGLLAYLSLFGALLVASTRVKPSHRIVFLGFVAVLLVESIFNAPFWYRMESFIFYSLLALLMAEASGFRAASSVNPKAASVRQ